MSKYLSYNTPGDEIRALRERVAKLERAQQSQFGGTVLAGGGGATKVYGISGTIGTDEYSAPYPVGPSIPIVLDGPATIAVTATVIESYWFLAPAPPLAYSQPDFIFPEVWPYPDSDWQVIVGPKAPLLHSRSGPDNEDNPAWHATASLTYICSFDKGGEVFVGVTVPRWGSVYPNQSVPLNFSVTAVVGEHNGQSNMEYESFGV